MKKGDLIVCFPMRVFCTVIKEFPDVRVWICLLDALCVYEYDIKSCRPAHMTFVGPVAVLSDGTLVTC